MPDYGGKKYAFRNFPKCRSSAQISSIGDVLGRLRAPSVATAIWLAIFVNTATVMFGALLNRVPDPFTMMSAFHFIYWILAIISGVSGVLGILAGCAILTAHPSGRILAIVASFFSLSFIPLGTTLGIFTIIEMLAISPTPLQEAHSELRTPYLKHPPLASSR